MLQNKALMELIKTDHTGSTLTMPVAEADTFLTAVLDQSVLKNNCRIVRMLTTDKYVESLAYGTGRFFQNASTFSTSNTKEVFAGNQIHLITKKIRACVGIRDEDVEDLKASGRNWQDAVMKLIYAKAANEIEEIAWIADNHNLGTFEEADPRSMFDGWRFIITHSGEGETYENSAYGSAILLDASLTSPDSTDFEIAGGISEQYESVEGVCCRWEHKYAKIRKSMPSKYWSVGKKNMRFWNQDKITMDYQDAIVARQTPAGDAALMGGDVDKYGGISIVNAPRMAVTLNYAGKLDAGYYTDVMLTDSQNLIMGVQRALTIEKTRDALNERDLYYFSMRLCFAVDNVNAVVLARNLTTA